MTTVFDDTPKYQGLTGDVARVTCIEDRVLIRAVDAMAEEGVTIAMSPEQARRLAEAIKDARRQPFGQPARCVGCQECCGDGGLDREREGHALPRHGGRP